MSHSHSHTNRIHIVNPKISIISFSNLSDKQTASGTAQIQYELKNGITLKLERATSRFSVHVKMLCATSWENALGVTACCMVTLKKMSILQAFYVLLTPVCPACEGSVLSHTVLSGGLIVSMFRVTPPHSAFPHTVELIPLISPSLCCYSLELS